MTKQEFIMSYFAIADEDDDETFYSLKPGYVCMYNDDLFLNALMVDSAGVHAGGDHMDFELLQPAEWKLVSMHISQKIEFTGEE